MLCILPFHMCDKRQYWYATLIVRNGNGRVINRDARRVAQPAGVPLAAGHVPQQRPHRPLQRLRLGCDAAPRHWGAPPLKIRIQHPLLLFYISGVWRVQHLWWDAAYRSRCVAVIMLVDLGQLLFMVEAKMLFFYNWRFVRFVIMTWLQDVRKFYFPPGISYLRALALALEWQRRTLSFQECTQNII